MAGAHAGRESFFQSLKSVLERHRDLQQRCAICSRTLIYREFEFWMMGENESCKVPLGFCPQCDGIPPTQETAVS